MATFYIAVVIPYRLLISHYLVHGKRGLYLTNDLSQPNNGQAIVMRMHSIVWPTAYTAVKAVLPEYNIQFALVVVSMVRA